MIVEQKIKKNIKIMKVGGSIGFFFANVMVIVFLIGKELSLMLLSVLPIYAISLFAFILQILPEKKIYFDQSKNIVIIKNRIFQKVIDIKDIYGYKQFIDLYITNINFPLKGSDDMSKSRSKQDDVMILQFLDGSKFWISKFRTENYAELKDLIELSFQEKEDISTSPHFWSPYW